MPTRKLHQVAFIRPLKVFPKRLLAAFLDLCQFVEHALLELNVANKLLVVGLEAADRLRLFLEFKSVQGKIESFNHAHQLCDKVLPVRL